MEFTKKVMKKKGTIFIGAVQEYKTDKGVLPVAFSPTSAYLLCDSDTEELFDTNSLVDNIKRADREGDFAYPEQYPEYVEVMELDDDINEYAVNTYGITSEIEEDIISRLDYIADTYGIEEPFDFS